MTDITEVFIKEEEPDWWMEGALDGLVRLLFLQVLVLC